MNNRFLMTLWVIASIGIAGIITAGAYKPPAKPEQSIHRKNKSDMLYRTKPTGPWHVRERFA